MKKLVMIFLIALFSISGIAQSKFGIRGGLNMANVDISASGVTIAPEARTTFFAGINFDIQINEKLSFSPGIQYTGRGYKLSSNGATSEAKLDYIDVPLLLNLRLPLSETTSILLSGGGMPGFLLAATGESSYNGRSESQDIKDGVETFHFGLTFGGGIEITSKNLIIVPQIYYTIGLTNMDKNNPSSSSNSSSEPEITASDLSFGLGIRF